ncbi:MAG: Alpha/beta hydrolase family protein [Alphaproteobacteria bacterium ADurb.Bin438]|nr:MAG: Alpha/beta hydrolase family protein [Alphaproteobacteria bacterium ADurb.Bin438]
MQSLKIMIIFFIKFLFFFYLFLIASLYIFQRQLIFKGSYSNLKFVNENNFKKIHLTTEDGVNIYAYIKEAETKSDKAIIIFHGNNDLAGNALKRHIENGFDDVDFDLIAIEYRGYDEIKPFTPSQDNLIKDVKSLIPLFKNYKKIVFKAHSIGSFPAIALSKFYNPDAIILEAPLYNMIKPASKVAFFMPFKLVNAVLKEKFENNKIVKDIQFNQALVLHSKDDKTIDFNDGKALFDLINAKNKKFKEYENYGHNDIVKYDYEDIKEFLKGI